MTGKRGLWGWYQARVHPFSRGNGKGDVPLAYVKSAVA